MKRGRKPRLLGADGLRQQITPAPILKDWAIPVFYDHNQAVKVAEKLMEGMSLAAISREIGFPSYATLLKWYHEIEPFRSRVQAARETHARHHYECAIAVAEDPECEPSDRFQIHRWAAEVNDPEKYGKQTKVTGDIRNPIRIVVETGLSSNRVDEVQLDEQGLIVQSPSGAV